MRIVFTGGGTGGHIFPNAAILKELAAFPKIQPLYIGERASLEEALCRTEGVPFYGIFAGKMRRYFDWKNFLDAAKTPVGFFQALSLLRTIKPRLVFSKSGYVSLPVMVAAAVLGIPIWLHESDLSPSLATRLGARWAEKIWLSFDSTRSYFPLKKTEVVGNPVRQSLLRGSRAEGFRLAGFSAGKPVLLVMGGSLGAASLNSLVFQAIPELVREFQILHITGGRDGEKFSNRAEYKGSLLMQRNYKSFVFADETLLAHLYAITDVCVSRAGSGAIFELLVLRKPMFLVPLPNMASRGDQMENAEYFRSRGWATVFMQEKASPQGFFADLKAFWHDREGLRSMRKSQEAVDFSGAARRIAQAMSSFQ
ncbi:UDP-N-acetylglucosamine--N-acetylmuramyl-(pentapeptide) pyrophosphoryl-undecaprenol N-acetylglucosamine transferase [Candidatus Peregrinibacteria bacterium]|nr:UDP-N-acetylglucosamine--N-acetylmuramyl-(pentapeptide) pyrophosphoryl-undecaprenol N-acetylglucosamine transferase [Candidatus Peregrinibacteria bacterium]